MTDEQLFVYGTLRRGCPTGAHNKFLVGATFIAPARVKGKLFKVSYYPALVIDETADWVTGEIYQLASTEQLAALDAYEECSYPALPEQEYQRRKITVLTDVGESLSVWGYAYQHVITHLEFIASGDFLNP